MCTSIALKTRDFYFGRNLDLECSFGEQVVITPRDYPLEFRKAGAISRHYAIIGMATVMENYPLYAEAANEKGLCMAGLNFPGNAFYPESAEPGKQMISPFELPLWLLGRCENLRQAKETLNQTALVSIPFSAKIPLSPLHWHIADETGSIVLESTRDGMKIYENPVGVMTNNPTFDFHLTNLRQYLNLTNCYPENRMDKDLQLTPFGVGFGAMGLPGDFSPASRFVRAAFLKAHAQGEEGEMGSIGQFFHLLSGVSMMDGLVETPNGKFEKTSYSCCINASKGIYYYTTYENRQITGIDLRKEKLESKELKIFSLNRKQKIAWEN